MAVTATERVACAWFVLCDRAADGVVAHSVLGLVPCCERCARVAGLTFERDDEKEVA